jgi:hypothetical protein
MKNKKNISLLILGQALNQAEQSLFIVLLISYF